jgi:peptidoglycan/xylan/chitin deacetylase (PgdA/CDA1 family)
MRIARIIKWTIAVVLYYLGMACLFRHGARKGVRVLLYHRVCETGDDILKIKVPPEFFEEEIRYLKDRYRVVSLREAIRIVRDEKVIRDDYVVITFDDGYHDNFSNALPILKKYGVPASIFLTASLVGTNKNFWYDTLTHIVLDGMDVEGPGIEIDFAKGPIRFSVDRKADKKRVLSFLVEKCKGLDPQSIDEFIAYLTRLVGGKSVFCEEDAPLTWDEVKTMRAEGVEIGSHGHHHAVLTRIADVRSEVVVSKGIIEERLNYAVTSFAYPNGRQADFDDAVKDALKAAGYECGLTTIDGVNSPGTDLFEMRRKGIEYESSASPWGGFSRALFACEVSGLFDAILMRRQRNG